MITVLSVFEIGDIFRWLFDGQRECHHSLC